MQKVELDKLRDFVKKNNTLDFSMPGSIDCICSFCNVLTNMQITDHVTNKATRSTSMFARCINCQKKSSIHIVKGKDSEGKEVDECWIHPKPNIREYRFTEDDIGEVRIWNAYKEALETFNNGNPISSITSCGRIVEGIAKTKFPNAQGTKQIGELFKNLQKESSTLHEDFSKILLPILSLGEALRIGRNTAGHFDLEKQPNKELASKIIDLTEFLIQYIYTLNKEANKVEELIQSLLPLEP
jgi:hypothetical protein